ncbi:PSP1 C-terminal conserved region-domain-containing protein [Mycena floridula]|nr:PSP1 C-terminal conserved region-domain-containing protein [Mycena floridula]
MQHSGHYQHQSDSDDRTNRFLHSGGDHVPNPMRERAASQPPRATDPNLLSSPSQQHFIPSSLAGGNSPWTTQRLLSNSRGLPQPIPTRSSSFSANQQAQFGSVMRERSFSSTFEDDELDTDTYDERYIPPSLSPVIRGRTYNQDLSRSRSQSLATTRPGAIGSPYLGTPAMASWNESFLSNPLNIPGARYGEIKPPGSSRYGSLGTSGRTSANYSSSPSGGSATLNGHSHRQPDISNMSPFVRDVGQILLDDGSAFRELWAGMNPPRDENGGGGSGTTSRRHSVSVVQPRRGTVVGFSVAGDDGPDEPSRPGFSQANFGRGGLMLSDEDLAGDLGRLGLHSNEPSSSQQSPSQPSSLPIYAPLSRSPPSNDLMSTYNHLAIPSSYSSRPSLSSPSDSGVSGGSPPRGSHFEQQLADAQFRQQHGQELTARFIPGQGIQYLPQSATNNQDSYSRNRAPSYSGSVSSPLSPSSSRSIQQQQQQQQQQQFYSGSLQRRPSDAPQQSLSDLGKGVPLHAVPASWPLFIVEFKAGRTDLFYLTDLSQDIRIGDLVIVEADRGKDLGKVINDSITLAEVEAFQQQQMDRIGFSSGQPTSPGGPASAGGSNGKKEINPKMIYGKAQQHDMQGLVTKLQDELKALQLCQTKVRAKKLPMEVVDAEYQWDRRKLTFYFVAEKRIDFRELVRELFRLYKTRIWMASLQGAGGFEQ